MWLSGIKVSKVFWSALSISESQVGELGSRVMRTYGSLGRRGACWGPPWSSCNRCFHGANRLWIYELAQLGLRSCKDERQGEYFTALSLTKVMRFGSRRTGVTV